jgi:hypothetical protein
MKDLVGQRRAANRSKQGGGKPKKGTAVKQKTVKGITRRAKDERADPRIRG